MFSKGLVWSSYPEMIGTVLTQSNRANQKRDASAGATSGCERPNLSSGEEGTLQRAIHSHLISTQIERAPEHESSKNSAFSRTFEPRLDFERGLYC